MAFSIVIAGNTLIPYQRSKRQSENSKRLRIATRLAASQASAILYVCRAMLWIVLEPLLATFCKSTWERLLTREHICPYTRQAGAQL
jgi:hypothetical protein